MSTEKVDQCLKCGNVFWNIGDYLDCIWCWYDSVYKRTLAQAYRWEKP